MLSSASIVRDSWFPWITSTVPVPSRVTWLTPCILRVWFITFPDPVPWVLLIHPAAATARHIRNTVTPYFFTFNTSGFKRLTIITGYASALPAPRQDVPCLLYTSPSPRDGLL